MGGRVKREGTYAYLWLIHVDIWQKPAQYCKAIILQFKKFTLKKLKEINPKHKQIKDNSLEALGKESSSIDKTGEREGLKSTQDSMALRMGF